MKRLLAFTTFLFTFSAITYAQSDCKLCGDWISTIWKKYPHNTRSDDNADWRMGKMSFYIRINKYGETYKIRIKRKYAEGDIGTVYDNDVIEILDASDSSIYFKATGEMSCDYDQYDRITGCDRLVLCFLITYCNGYIHYQLTDVYSLEYNKYKQYVGTTRGNLTEWLELFPEYNMDLYKEDNDW